MVMACSDLPKDAVLFAGTIRENLVSGESGISMYLNLTRGF